MPPRLLPCFVARYARHRSGTQTCIKFLRPDAMGGWLTGLAGERQTVPLPTRCQWLSHPECMWLRQQTIAPACAIVYMQRVGKTTGFTVIRFQLKAVGLKKPRGRNRDQMMSTGNDELTNLNGRVVTMTMPGFTAEVSLCENRGRYRRHGPRVGPTGSAITHWLSRRRAERSSLWRVTA